METEMLYEHINEKHLYPMENFEKYYEKTAFRSQMTDTCNLQCKTWNYISYIQFFSARILMFLNKTVLYKSNSSNPVPIQFRH